MTATGSSLALPHAKPRSVHWARDLAFALLPASILLLPVNWLLGTSLPWLFATAAFLAFGLARFSLVEWLLLALASALGISLLASTLVDFELQRIVASVYNLLIIAALVTFINWGRQVDHLSRTEPGFNGKRRIFMAAFIVYLVYVATIAGVKTYVTLTGDTTVSFDTLILGQFGTLPGILAQYGENVLAGYDWINGTAQLRIHGLGVYATESAIQFVAFAMLAAIYMVRTGRPVAAILIELSILPALFVIGSRTTGLAYVLSLLLLWAVWRQGIALAIAVLSPLALACLILFGPDLVDEVQETLRSLASSRAGSTESRLLTYTLAIDAVLDRNLLIGLGIKPHNPFLPMMPIGSHSSVVSMFTKGGLLALSMFAVFHLLLLARVVIVQLGPHLDKMRMTFAARFEMVMLARIVFIWLLWTLTEDFDAPIYQTLLVGLAIGMFWNASQTIRRQ